MTTWLWHMFDRWEQRLLFSSKHVYHVDHKDLMMDFKEAGDDPNFPPPPPKLSFGPPHKPWSWVSPTIWVTCIFVLSFVVWVMAR